MKILPFKIAKPVNESFWIQREDLVHMYDILHQHDEMQITLIREGTGTLIAGNRVCEFVAGDIFVFGYKLPHAFRNDPAYYHPENGLVARSTSVYFEWNVPGQTFWNLPENRLLTEFAAKTERGIFFPANTHWQLASDIEKLAEVTEIDRLILLLSVLKQLALSPNAVMLSTEGAYSKLNENDEKRLDAVYRFTMNEFHRTINLDEIAGIANMTVNSFCRYFKTRTRKSYLDFLTEYRIGQACKMLQQEEMSIADIAFHVGFGNLSNFNRKFKEINGCTPREFRMKQEK
ncbi:MAG: AraC family transcriptional regulator [Bacteroidetes bacterium]|nr:AraC family transcriptional regulator [Bacteroidota bacterium]